MSFPTALYTAVIPPNILSVNNEAKRNETRKAQIFETREEERGKLAARKRRKNVPEGPTQVQFCWLAVVHLGKPMGPNQGGRGAYEITPSGPKKIELLE